MTPNRVLLVQQNWLGDVLFATPAIRAVRKTYPQAHIVCLVPTRTEAVLKNNPHVNEVIVYDDRAAFFSPAFWKTVFLLRAKHFDTALFFHRSKTKVWLAKFAGIHSLWGYSRKGLKNILTKAVELPAAKLHKIDHFLFLVRALGVPSDGRGMEFVPAEGAAAQLEKILGEAGVLPGESYVVVHAGGNWRLKRWPAEYFSQWIDLFLHQYDWKVILCGTGDEKRITDKILSKFSQKKVISLCGKTTLDTLALLLKGSRLLLSNDSGPIHLAASQKTRLVGLFGPTSAGETGPVSDAPMKILQKDVGCQVPCYFESCNYRVCMDLLLPRDVFLETQSLLSVT